MVFRRLIFLLVGVTGTWLTASTSHLADVEAFVEEINSMREALAMGVTGNADADTFAAVCKPVGMKAKSVAQENQWLFRQVSLKYRNPSNKPTPTEVKAIGRFQDDPSLLSFWDRHEASATLQRRIVVQKACLACHGAKDDRPAFVKEKYPDDLAWGFAEGDLRGIFSVTVKLEK